MDLSLITVALTGFIVLAGVVSAIAIATIVVAVTEPRRRPARPVVAISAAHPAVAATARRAA